MEMSALSCIIGYQLGYSSLTAKQVITGRFISNKITAVKDFYTNQDANLVTENWTGNPQPCRQFILDTVELFENTGSVYDLPRSGRTKTATNDENVEKVKKILKKTPTSPIRAVSAKAALLLSSTERIKLRLGLKSYRMQRRHALLLTDLSTRKAVCEAFLLQQKNNKQFKRRLIFTDECSFQLGGTVNTYNCYYHSLENPHYTADVWHKQGSLMVFCDICEEYVFGPYFIHDNIDQNVYQSTVYDQLPQSFIDLKFSIIETVSSITTAYCKAACDAAFDRFHKCVTLNGDNVE
ncbi:MAG: hypothetical protein EZS28_008721 [Streblomastix strix]|uniref:Uncharacterized protein n=1 Tax=Streblomastix strix TaxID=222440 RepID=A0A5J4WN01_9EUKA|nr:MAG: hypothetical protein EZS28_008721 [Streblomastix strix]